MAANDNIIKYEEAVDKLNETLRSNLTVLDQVATGLNLVNTEFKNIPSAFLKAQKDVANNAIKQAQVEKSLQNAVIATQRARQQAIVTDIKSIQLQKQRVDLSAKETRELERAAKAVLKADQELQKSQNTYNQIQKEVNGLIQSYNNLAIKQELNINLTEDEKKELASLTQQINKYQTALGNVDKNIQKYGRSVGNYASGFNPLGAAIGQISREIPNFAQSVQIGILSLTNNIGQLQDAIGGVIAQNKALAAEGKATRSVMSQIGSQILSFNTVLYLGVAALTAYGAEIGEWLERLFDGSSALDELIERQKEFNEGRITGKKDAQEEIIELRKYLAVVKDQKLSDEERQIALKKLREQYPFYFKSLSDAQILAGQSAEAERKVTEALEKKFEVQKKTELNVTNKQKIIDIDNEIRKTQELIDLKRKDAEQLTSVGAKQDVISKTYKDIKSLEQDRNQLQIDRAAYQKQEIANDTEIFNLKKEIIGLEYSADALKDAEAYFKYISGLNEEQYELDKFRREREIEELVKVAENEKATFEGRIEAYGEMLKKKQDLLKFSLDFELKQSAESRRKEVYDADKEYIQNREKFANDREALARIESDHRAELSSINARFNAKDVLSKEKFNKEYLDLVEETAKAEIEIANRREEMLRRADDYVFQRESAMFKRIGENERLAVEVRQQAFNAQMAIERKRLDLAEIREKSENPENIEEITEKYKNLRIALEDLESPYEKTAKAIQSMFEAMTNSLQGDMFKGLDAFKQFFDGSFVANLKAFDLISDKAQGMREKTAYAFVQIAEAAQEAFNFIDSIQQQQFDRQYERLDAEKENALAFAGESTEAREEIERQYEERRKQIARQQAEAEKRSAIFNTVINTAQAIVATLAKTPPPAGLPLAAIMAAIGAAQIAVIASQPIPEFKLGLEAGEHKGGLMKINDGKDRREIIEEPSGRVSSPISRNLILNKPKGTLVYTPKQWEEKQLMKELNGILSDRGIGNMSSSLNIVNSQNNGIEESMTRALTKAISAMPEGDKFTIIDDARGKRIYQSNQSRMTELVNNRKTFTAKRIGR